MGRIIKIQFNDKTYKLEYNRKSLLEVANIKFDDKDIVKNYDGLVKLVMASFEMHQPDITKEEVENIISSIEDIGGFVNALSTLIQEGVDVINSKKGNAHWEVV